VKSEEEIREELEYVVRHRRKIAKDTPVIAIRYWDGWEDALKWVLEEDWGVLNEE